jgi:hypothetical protein
VRGRLRRALARALLRRYRRVQLQKNPTEKPYFSHLAHCVACMILLAWLLLHRTPKATSATRHTVLHACTILPA